MLAAALPEGGGVNTEADTRGTHGRTCGPDEGDGPGAVHPPQEGPPELLTSLVRPDLPTRGRRHAAPKSRGTDVT